MQQLAILLLLTSFLTFSQKNINNYKYIIIPAKFDFVKSQDQYQTSSLTKFLFNKKGFKAYLDSEKLPKELISNPCLALTANVIDASSLFTTKSFIEIENCHKEVIFRTKEGKSKEKEYKKAYHQAIRVAFKSVQQLKYNYSPEQNSIQTELTAIYSPAKEKHLNLDKAKEELLLLYAQPVLNGFQLVNTTPEKLYVALKTSLKNVFILQNKNGVLYKANSEWIAEYYQNGNRIVKKYQIKF